LDGGEVRLADYRGRPVFINFWASWCGPCQVEMPEIIAAYDAHRSAGLEVLAIDNTQLDVIDDVRDFVIRFNMPFPVLLDESGEVLQAYQVIGLPTSVFVDAGGIVRGVNAGPLTGEQIAAFLNQILLKFDH
jgi:thiol-disulfide isomerase/thioredoxin